MSTKCKPPTVYLNATGSEMKKRQELCVQKDRREMLLAHVIEDVKTTHIGQLFFV